MSRPVRLALNGASGRMGGAILDLLGADDRFELVHAVVAADSDVLDAPVPGIGDGSLRFASGWKTAPAIDVMIDFSAAAGLQAALDHCVAHGIALVSGTTGLDAGLTASMEAAAGQIALLRADNFSLGVTMLRHLLAQAAAGLPDWDLEIIEAHHGRKQDAPSGTALALGQAAAVARSTTLDKAVVYGRQGHTGARADGAIGFAVVRGGDIVGEHTALLIGQGERLELGHRATDRAVFARGALQAAHWLVGRPSGRWQLEDVIT